jgi:hypothetical protein
MNGQTNTQNNFQERIDLIMSRYTLVNQVFVRLDDKSTKKTQINKLNESFNNFETENLSQKIKKLVLLTFEDTEASKIQNKQIV